MNIYKRYRCLTGKRDDSALNLAAYLDTGKKSLRVFELNNAHSTLIAQKEIGLYDPFKEGYRWTVHHNTILSL